MLFQPRHVRRSRRVPLGMPSLYLPLKDARGERAPDGRAGTELLIERQVLASRLARARTCCIAAAPSRAASGRCPLANCVRREGSSLARSTRSCPSRRPCPGGRGCPRQRTVSSIGVSGSGRWQNARSTYSSWRRLRAAWSPRSRACGSSPCRSVRRPPQKIFVDTTIDSRRQPAFWRTLPIASRPSRRRRPRRCRRSSRPRRRPRSCTRRRPSRRPGAVSHPRAKRELAHFEACPAEPAISHGWPFSIAACAARLGALRRPRRREQSAHHPVGHSPDEIAPELERRELGGRARGVQRGGALERGP